MTNQHATIQLRLTTLKQLKKQLMKQQQRQSCYTLKPNYSRAIRPSVNSSPKSTSSFSSSSSNTSIPLLGGISSVTKYDKNKLSIPTLNNKVRAREIIDAFKSYMAHRATEYYAVLPYMNYVADSYNAEDGTYIETPDKAQKYNTVDPCLYTAYGATIRICCIAKYSSALDRQSWQRSHQHSDMDSTSKRQHAQQ